VKWGEAESRAAPGLKSCGLGEIGRGEVKGKVREDLGGVKGGGVPQGPCSLTPLGSTGGRPGLWGRRQSTEGAVVQWRPEAFPVKPRLA